MNGDLNLSLIVEAQLMDGALSSSRASPSKRETHAASCVEFDDRASCRRMKVSVVNGFIVYTRTKKKKLNEREMLMENVDTKRVKGLEEPKPKDSTYFSARVLLHKSSVVESDSKQSYVNGIAKRMETSVEDVTKVRSVDIKVINSTLAGDRYSVEELENDKSLVEIFIEGYQAVEMFSEEINVEVVPEGMLDFDIENQKVRNGIGTVPSCSSRVLVNRTGNLSRNHASLKQTRRLTRSKSVHKLKKFDLLDSKLENEADPNINVEGNLLETEQKKPISITNRPMTVKELFGTGLLDGVSVIYMGTFKSLAFGLRGVIKDGGILCSCSLCNSRRVIPPSKFEIHACQQYKRASQYICFENGRSLLDVLKLCRKTPLHDLEAAITDAVSGSPIEKSFTCKRCKGLFTFSCLGQPGPLCNSCSEEVRSHRSPVSSRISRSAPARIPSPGKSQLKITRKSAVTGLVGESYIGASASIPPRNKNRWKLKKMSTKQAFSKASKHAPLSDSLQKRNQWKVTIKDQQSHKLIFEKGGLPDGTELAYYARGQKLLEGYKKGSGIFCYCCKCEVSPSQFEAHAGWASRRKPYAYIYTSNGLSLHEWAIALSKGQKYSVDNYELCVICANGGDLLLCDGCPRAFHKECASLPSIPQGNWYCKYCERTNERENFVEDNVNAVADGPVTGVDPIEQITRRCIRVVKNIESETSGCVLCNAFDFCRSGFGPRTVIICDQCEKEYHIGCLRNHKIVDLKELPEGKWFCCMDCTKIHSTLQTLLLGGDEKVSDSYVEAIRVKEEETDAETATDLDIRWRLVSGKVASPESRMLLSQVLQIFHDCFDPIINPISGHNLIPRMVYGKNMKDEDFGGMCCAVLTVNSKVVSAGLLRVFGQEVAELPLVATVIDNRRKGYFQLLFSCIEKLLSFLNVETIVLPAAEEAESIWMNKFGFNKIAPEQLTKYMKICYQMVRFKGASMLQKRVRPCQILDRTIEPDKSSPETLPADGENS